MRSGKTMLAGGVAVLFVLLVGFLFWSDGRNALDTERGQLGGRRTQTIEIGGQEYPIKNGIESMVVLAKEVDGAENGVQADVHSAFLMLMNHELKAITVIQIPFGIELVARNEETPAGREEDHICTLRDLLTAEKAAGRIGQTARDAVSKLLFGIPISHYLAIESEQAKQVLKQYPGVPGLLPAAWQDHAFFRLLSLKGQPKSEMENVLRALWPHMDTDVSKGGLINLVTRIKAYDIEYRAMAFSKERLETNRYIGYYIGKRSLDDFVLETLADTGQKTPQAIR